MREEEKRKTHCCERKQILAGYHRSFARFILLPHTAEDDTPHVVQLAVLTVGLIERCHSHSEDIFFLLSLARARRFSCFFLLLLSLVQNIDECGLGAARSADIFSPPPPVPHRVTDESATNILSCQRQRTRTKVANLRCVYRFLSSSSSCSTVPRMTFLIMTIH